MAEDIAEIDIFVQSYNTDSNIGKRTTIPMADLRDGKYTLRQMIEHFKQLPAKQGQERFLDKEQKRVLDLALNEDPNVEIYYHKTDYKIHTLTVDEVLDPEKIVFSHQTYAEGYTEYIIQFLLIYPIFEVEQYELEDIIFTDEPPYLPKYVFKQDPMKLTMTVPRRIDSRTWEDPTKLSSIELDVSAGTQWGLTDYRFGNYKKFIYSSRCVIDPEFISKGIFE